MTATEAKRPVASAPQVPPIPCTPTTSDEKGHTLVGGIGAKKGIDPENYNETTESGYSVNALNLLQKRIPGMERGVFRGGRAACDGVSDDEYSIIDKVREVEGFYYAVGYSGQVLKLPPL